MKVSEQILNGTSAQLGYTVPFTSVYAGKYERTQIKNRHYKKIKNNTEKANNTKYSKTKPPWFSRLSLHSARKRGGLNPKLHKTDLLYNKLYNKSTINPQHSRHVQ